MKKALISVTDKTGIVNFAKRLINLDYEIISTGGTFDALKNEGVPATAIEEITGFPEILDGRVKTLHPMIHGGLLYKRNKESHLSIKSQYNIPTIDMVVVNLYDFQGTLNSGALHEIIVENIDIGGPSMIRSAAKNYESVLVVVDTNDYEEVIKRLESKSANIEFREYLAMKGFSATAYYDSIIARYFIQRTGKCGDKFTLGLSNKEELRYGENPHQDARVYNDGFVDSPLSSYRQLHGKAMSFNNFNDLNAAVELLKEFDFSNGEFAAVAVKHATACGVAIGKDGKDAYNKAYEADKLSIFGGIVAVNFPVDEDTAILMRQIFLEVIAAPKFERNALEILMKKANVRLIELDIEKELPDINIKYVGGKVLVQTADKTRYEDEKIATKKEPTMDEMKDLRFAMKVCKHIKSNGVVIAKNGATIALGGGQTSRIWALETALNNYSDKDFKGCVMASDAFFPFSDCTKLASKIGISAIIQPGGAQKDQDSIDVCNDNNIAMIFTGVRHFKH